MSDSDIYRKTEKGKQEIAHQSGALSMLDRRLLIMLNGNTPLSEIRKRSLVSDFDNVLQLLIAKRFVELATPGEAEPETVVKHPAADPVDPAAARELMVNTLKTFGNQFRIKGLLGEIEAAPGLRELQNLLPGWYQAIAETPNGMYQADDLRADLKKLLGV